MGIFRLPKSFAITSSKYHNKKTVVDNIEFDSVRESRRYADLVLLAKSGAISNLRTQVKKELIPSQPGERPVSYICDFVYDAPGGEVWEDCKGMRTPDYVIKRKLMLYLHNIRVLET